MSLSALLCPNRLIGNNDRADPDRSTLQRMEHHVNELLENLQSKAGLSSEQAQKAVGVVADFLENKLDADQLQSFASKVPGLSQFSDKIPDNVGDQLGGMARGLFGKKD